MNTQYYRVTKSANAKTVGVVPQVQELIYPSTWDSPHSLLRLHYQPVDEQTEVPGCLLASKARLTDLLSTTIPIRLCVSQKLKSIIDEMSVFGIEFVPTEVISANTKHPYWLANYIEPGYQFLDPDKSRFVIMADVMNRIPIEEVSLTDASEIMEAFEQDRLKAGSGGVMHKPLQIEEIQVRHTAEVDFFFLPGDIHFGIGYYMSDRLKNRIQQAGCTGILFGLLNGRVPYSERESL